jgi:hypothetical protein
MPNERWGQGSSSQCASTQTVTFSKNACNAGATPDLISLSRSQIRHHRLLEKLRSFPKVGRHGVKVRRLEAAYLSANAQVRACARLRSLLEITCDSIPLRTARGVSVRGGPLKDTSVWDATSRPWTLDRCVERPTLRAVPRKDSGSFLLASSKAQISGP